MAENGDIRGETALIIALARGDSQREAAQASGVSLRTITRRMSDPEFVARVQLERARLVERVGGRLAASAVSFADVLLEVARDRSAPPSARVSAARAGLEFGLRLRDDGALEHRLSPPADTEADVDAQIRADVAGLSDDQLLSELAAWMEETRHSD